MSDDEAIKATMTKPEEEGTDEARRRTELVDE